MIQLKSWPEAATLGGVAATAGLRGTAGGEASQADQITCASQSQAVQVTIGNDDVEHQLGFAGPESGLPSALHGILWMDQTGYYQTRPDRPDQSGDYETLPGQNSSYKTFPHNLESAFTDLLVSFAGSVWDNSTQCARISTHMSQWTYANTTGTSEGSLMWWATEGSFLHFCLEEQTGMFKILHERCADGETSQSMNCLTDSGQRFVPRPWGFERLNLASYLITADSQIQVATRYAAYQIVDGNGRRTQNYQAYSDFMKERCWFVPKSVGFAPFADDVSCASRGGFLVNLGEGTQIVGRPPQEGSRA